MSLQLVYGPAGCGKSTIMQTRIIEEAIKNPAREYLMIVPDQFTMQTQMDMVKRHPNGGIMNIDVLSFSRLTYRVFAEAGGPSYPVLDDTGKSLVLRHVAGSVADKMPYIGANLNKIGYIHEVKSMISEFMQYGISVKDVEKLADSLNDGLLRTKLKDLNVIYDAFSAYNRDKFITNEETLDILCNKLSEVDFVKGAHIVFDGFTGFTPIQERVILKLLELADKVTVTLTLSNPEKPDEKGAEEKLFYLTRTTGNRLVSLCEKNKITVDTYEMLEGDNGRFKDNAEISHLEKYIFRYPVSGYKGKPETISAFVCHDIRGEISEITLKIHELVKSGKYAYRDIAVVVGNLDAYGDIFETRMKELDMPCFIDRTSGIVLNPFIEYLKSALQIVIKDFSYDSVFHYLKSGFVDYDEDAIDRFDKYVESLNIRGKSRYGREFTKRQRGMDRAFAAADIPGHEEVRKQLYGELSALLKPSKTAGEYVENLYEFLKSNKSYEKLKEYELMFEQSNNLAKAKEYGQIYKLIMELLNTIHELIGSEEMDITEFYRIFEAGISEIQVGTIPKNVDRVLIGDIERTRLNEIKVLFFAGVNDGNIPKASETTGILSNSERAFIASKDYDLSPTDQIKMYTQRLYLYTNLCKPTDKLFISYAATDREGKGLRPSYLIGVINKLFPELEVEVISDDITVDRIVNMRDSLSFYSRLIKNYSEGLLDEAGKVLTESLYKYYRDENCDVSDRITDAAFYEYVSNKIPREIVKLIYGETIKASISRMELYAKCAYAHYLMYGMELTDNREADFNAMDLGTVYHGILDRFAFALEERGLSFATFDDEEGKKILKEVVTAYCEDYEQGMLMDTSETQYIINKISKILERTISVIKYQVSKGGFVPGMHEKAFRREIPLDDGMMEIKGRIDRIDVYSEGDRIYVRIVDYKSSGHDIDITNVYHGIEQQLPLYMAEALYSERAKNPGMEVVPAAMFYYKIDDPVVEAGRNDSPAEVEKAVQKELAFTGYLNSDPEIILAMDRDAKAGSNVLHATFNNDGSLSKKNDRAITTEELVNMTEYTERLVTSIGNRINDGDISINPMKPLGDKKDACKYCAFKAICRFDEKISGYISRDGRETDKEEIKERVMGGKEDGLYLFN